MKGKDSNLMLKKNFVILSLVMMLGLIGYINYSLNRQSLLTTSNELENYEMRMMEESGILEQLYGSEEYELVESEGLTEEAGAEAAEGDQVEVEMDNAIIVDSHESAVVDLTQETSAGITEQLTSQETMGRSAYFIESRLERDKKRSALVSELDDMIKNQYSSDTVRNQAMAMKLDMVANTEAEVLIENMILAKGFPDAVVYLSGESINVVVQSPGLTEAEVAQIVDIITRETSIKLDNIVIMNKQ